MCFEPIQPINRSDYLCGKHFYIDELVEMYKAQYLNQTKNIDIMKNYGAIFICGDDYSIYQITKSLQNYQLTKLYGQNVSLVKKHKKGGQSAPRFSRIQKENKHNYITIVSEKLVATLVKLNINNLFIIGNGMKKDLLAKSELIQSRFNVLSILTISSTNQETILNFINNELKYQINNFETLQAQKYINKINDYMMFHPDYLTYGENDIINNLDKIKEIYYDKTLNLEMKVSNPKIKLIPLDNLMDSIGINCIGVKFWSE